MTIDVHDLLVTVISTHFKPVGCRLLPAVIAKNLSKWTVYHDMSV